MNQHLLNHQIEELITKKDAIHEKYSSSDIDFIKQYEGSGGQGKQGASGQGILHEFFTPDFVVDLMWELARHYGYEDGNVLETSIGTGRMIKPAKDYTKCVGFEINAVSARIAELTYPGIKVYNSYFETAFLEEPRYTSKLKSKLTWLKEYPFSLVIGNPPYGAYQNQYSSYFPESKKLKQVELFFIYKGLQLLKSGGLLVYLTGSNFLRNGDSYNEAKYEIEKLCDLVDAYRLPPVFRFSQIPTDIIVLRKK
ncbi:MAG TPA: N-6 DNA methylase [Cytophagaceae bacterium]|nr:N-6 DNA methylase [Cytophagaceae bacterium]